MKRRRFLQQAGLGMVAGGGALTAPTDLATAGAERVSEQNNSRRVLVTSAHAPLAQAIADELAADYGVRLTASSAVTTRHPLSKCDLGDEKAVNLLVRGINAIVHVAWPRAEAGELEHIDYRTRGTYNLLRSAAKAGVRHVVYLSSLRMMTDYDEDYEVTEDWRPVPSDDARVLSHYLGECTCREFAREGRLGVVVLRTGTIVSADEVTGKPFDPLWVDQRDVVQAVSQALRARLSDRGPPARNWSVFHIQSSSPQARFTSRRAQSEFGYAPRFP